MEGGLSDMGQDGRRCRGLDAGWMAFVLHWLEEEEDPARGAGPEDAAHQARRPTRPTLAQSPPISSLADAVVLLAEGAAVPPLALTGLERTACGARPQGSRAAALAHPSGGSASRSRPPCAGLCVTGNGGRSPPPRSPLRTECQHQICFFPGGGGLDAQGEYG